MITVNQLTQKGTGDMNEDALIINEICGIYGVLDGVSSLVPFYNEKNETGGYIASHLVKEYFEASIEINDLYNHVKEMNYLLQQKMKPQISI